MQLVRDLSGVRDLSVHHREKQLMWSCAKQMFCGWLAGTRTSHIHLLRVNWCYTSVSQGKQDTFTTLLSLLISSGGSKARREKPQPAEDSAFPFCESEKKLNI